MAISKLVQQFNEENEEGIDRRNKNDWILKLSYLQLEIDAIQVKMRREWNSSTEMSQRSIYLIMQINKCWLEAIGIEFGRWTLCGIFCRTINLRFVNYPKAWKK